MKKKLENIKCDICKKRFKTLGGLVFSPPKKNFCKKYHICSSCWKVVKNVF